MGKPSGRPVVPGPSARGPLPGEQQHVDREQAAKIKKTQDRINYIVDLMSDLHYLKRSTVRELAISWQLSTQRVDQLSQSAAAVMRAALGGFEPIRTKCILGITRIHEETFARAKESGDDFAAAKLYEVALKATDGMLAFTSAEFNEHLSTMKERRDAERHERDMRQGVTSGPISLDDVLQAEQAAKDNVTAAPEADAQRPGS